ncbi:MAG: hypothetical protein RI909_868 [Bacteroidota bacterium]
MLRRDETIKPMSTRTSSSNSTVLVVIILVLTFPLWIGLGGALIGVVAGLFGAMIGIIAALFGAVVALIALPFKLIFGWGDWGWHGPHVDGNGFVWLALLIVAALLINRRKK